jgi:spore coat polysaccharide biosynthesis predicted glycosyltransferase SpsG
MDYTKRLGIEKVKEYNYPIITFEGEDALFKNLEKINPNIVINDVLDTDKEYILKLKNRGYFVVNFEDLGEGSEFANIVINALYENSYPPENHYYGYKYVCLKDDFFIFSKKVVQKEVKTILITFGGTDPNNLTLRTLKAMEKLNLKDVFINVILGLGYNQKEELYIM